MPITPFKRISSFFGYRRRFRTSNGRWSSSYHGGIDLPAPRETNVPAMEDGVVEKIVRRPRYGYGNYVVLRHKDGSKTLYAHLNSIENIKVGEAVKKGMRLGGVGTTGNSTGNHLHFTYMDSTGRKINPLKKYSLADFNRLATGENNQDPYQKAIPSAPNWWQRNMPTFFGGWSQKRLASYYQQKALDKDVFTGISVRDLLAKNFETADIKAMQKLIAEKQRASLSDTLRKNGIQITSEDLHHIGLSHQEVSRLIQMGAEARDRMS